MTEFTVDNLNLGYKLKSKVYYCIDVLLLGTRHYHINIILIKVESKRYFVSK